MTDAAARYAARVAAVLEQNRRHAGAGPPDDRWASRAAFFRMDPRRPLDPNLAALARYVQPEDVVLDVGGGAGRVLLPLAPRCREAICVDPSAAMEEHFLAAAREAGLTNVRFLRAAWPVDGVSGDLTIGANVTHFVQDIVPFLAALNAATRRRVIVTVWSVPPPAQDAALFRLVHGEEQIMPPGHQELLPVLWEMGILPDVHVLPGTSRGSGASPRTRVDAIHWAAGRVDPENPERVAGVITREFEQLFAPTPDGFAPRWRPAVRELLITWER